MKRVCFNVRPITVVNKGASFGPRVATATFTFAHYRLPRFEVSVSADIDGTKYQDESGVRRRAGRAAVPVARRAASAIASGELAPSAVLTSADAGWCRATWLHLEEFEGFARVARASVDFRTVATIADEMQPPEELVAVVVQTFRSIANDLHVSIDDPEFRPIFGGR